MIAPAPFYHHRLALVDLAAAEARVLPLPPEVREQGVGGAALAEVLEKAHPGAMIFAAGPLTGSFAPASGQMSILLPQPGGQAVHVAPPLGHGAWLRRSGFDAMVVTGAGTAPRAIRCYKGGCAVEDAPRNIPSGRAALRAALLRRADDGRAGLLLAGKPDSGTNPPPAAGAEYGPISGGALLARAMNEKNLLACALEGGAALPPMPVPLDNALRRGLRLGSGPQDALADELTKGAARPVFLPPGLRYKRAACHHCVSPCLAWVAAGSGRHLLAGDHAGFAAALEACGPDAPVCLALCDDRGLDAASAAPLLAGLAARDMPAALDAASAAACPPPSPATMTEAMTTGLILGICPRLVRREPSLIAETLSAAIDGDTSSRLVRAAGLVTRRVYL